MNQLELQRAADIPDEVFQDLESKLMANIIRHCKDWGQPIATDAWLMKKLAEIGRLNQENIRIIARSTGLAQTAIEHMLEEVAEQVISEIEPTMQQVARAGIIGEAVPVEQSKNIKQVLKTMRKQAKSILNLCNTNMLYKARDAYQNFVHSMASAADEIAQKQSFIDTMDKHATSAIIGVESRHQALRKCIKEFNEKGIPAFVDKRGREWTPEAYVNMAMRSTSNTMAAEIQMARADDFGIDLVEVDSHSGARPKCAKDQGKIFDRSNRSDKYPHWNTSSYGEPDGLLGINCGHHIFPYMEGVSIRRHFPTEDLEANNKLYKEVQVQRALERDVRRQKRECMLLDQAGDKEGFDKSAVKLKEKETRLKEYVDQNDNLHRRRDREQVVGFDKRVSAEAVASKKRIAKQANRMYDTGSEAGNIKAYYRDKPLRDRIQSDSTKKELEPGQYKKHVLGSHEYQQYQDKYKRQNQYGPSYLTIDEKKAQELVNKYAGTGILTRSKNGSWANEEIITVHPQDIGVAVNNLDGKEAPTSVFKIKYGKKGTHIVPDYPSKKGAKARK